MEWLVANAVNLFMAAVMVCGGIVFTKNLDNRLKNIEREQAETKQLVVVYARLDERIGSMNQMVIAQGKRLDRVIERVYGRTARQNEDDESN